MKGCIASAASESNYVILSIVDKLGALLDVDIISADIKHYSNVAFVLRRRDTKRDIVSLFVFQDSVYCA